MTKPTTDNPRQPALALALLLAGLGNLVLPVVVQDLLPTDYLLLTLALCGLVILYQFRLVLARAGMWWPAAAFSVACIPGFLVGPPTAYGLTKAQAILVILILFVACAAVRHPPTFIRNFTVAAIIVGAFFSVAAQIFGTQDVGGRLVFLGLNPIGIGRVAGFVLVVTLTLVIVRIVRSPLLILGAVVTATVTAVGVVATGSRGPLVAAAVALAGLVFFLARTKRLAPRTTILIVLSGLTAVAAIVFSDSAGLTRLTTASDSGRSDLYTETLHLAFANPMGIGWGRLGQFIVDFRAIDEESLYAHNVFLEILVEGGVFALVAVTALFAACFVQAWRAAKVDSWFSVIFVVLVYTVASAQFSSDIVGNRLMWLYMGFSLMAGWWVTRATSDETSTEHFPRPRRDTPRRPARARR
ncbi:O-antigen ligase family protein [Frigoribacterium sp. CFBP 13605]|uniref:O-antigen ligase family protein n=1 Tax=Frigoribacterium sp. CFBP 13605 TaxID=2774034 RepID=UPI001904F76E|nr:O-antigen ligase family protein [Frigoribacterium sp. CFBP 13605]MBD8140023.1 O-antigen ligase family protein [Frigoribacterium sp. CFBP 13605]